MTVIRLAKDLTHLVEVGLGVATTKGERKRDGNVLLKNIKYINLIRRDNDVILRYRDVHY